MRPRLKPALRRVTRDERTLQFGLHPRHAVLLTDLEPEVRRLGREPGRRTGPPRGAGGRGRRGDRGESRPDPARPAGQPGCGRRRRHHHQRTVAVSTISRYLSRLGLVVPEPNKRPKASYIRFAADQPNQCWQADFTHYRLANGAEVEILSFLDDYSRYALSVTAHHRVTGPIVLAGFRRTCSTYGVPASTLTDNGLVFTTRYSGGRGGRNGFETELHRLGVVQKNSRPNHPTTCGKVERFQQTLKKWLAAQPVQPTTLEELQALLNRFIAQYNQHRPHRSLPHQATPATAYAAHPKAAPGDRSRDTHNRVRTDRVDNTGKVTLRHGGRLYSIGIGRTHARTRVLILVQDLHIRIVNAATGELLRELTLNPTKRYQGTGRPPGPPPPK